MLQGEEEVLLCTQLLSRFQLKQYHLDRAYPKIICFWAHPELLDAEQPLLAQSNMYAHASFQGWSKSC